MLQERGPFEFSNGPHGISAIALSCDHDPLHNPPAPLAIGAVAKGTYMEVGIPAANAAGPAAVPHQLHCTLIVPGALRSHANRIADIKLEKSLVVTERLLGVVEALSMRTTE